MSKHKLSRAEQRIMNMEIEEMKEENRENIHQEVNYGDLISSNIKADIILLLANPLATVGIDDKLYAITRILSAFDINHFSNEECTIFFSGTVRQIGQVLDYFKNNEWGYEVMDNFISVFRESHVTSLHHNQLNAPKITNIPILVINKGIKKFNYLSVDTFSIEAGQETKIIEKLLSLVSKPHQTVLDLYVSPLYDTVKAVDTYHCNSLSVAFNSMQKNHIKKQLTSLKLR